jgi:predicted regulator of Ras-like GTPase activity (Roadblock/LC7/MglB family)
MELHDIQELAKKVDSLVATNDSLVKSNAVQTAEIKEIKDALLGSALATGKGMIESMRDHDERIKALENIKNKVFWIAIGAGVAGGWTLGKIVTVIATAYSH